MVAVGAIVRSGWTAFDGDEITEAAIVGDQAGLVDDGIAAAAIVGDSHGGGLVVLRGEAAVLVYPSGNGGSCKRQGNLRIWECCFCANTPCKKIIGFLFLRPRPPARLFQFLILFSLLPVSNWFGKA